MKRQHLIVAAVSLLTLAGCASNGTPPPEGDRVQRDVASDIGFRISGMETSADKPGALQRAIQGDDSDESDEARLKRELAETEKRLTQLEQSVLASAAAEPASPRQAGLQPAVTSGPRTKLGVYYAGNPAISGSLTRALATAAADYPVSLADSAAVAQEIQKAGCGSLAGNCVGTLAVYPGVQLLAVVQGFQAADPTRGTIELLDPETGVKLQTLSAELPAAQSQVPPQVLDALADRLLLAATSRGANSRWSTRAFTRQGEQWYLSAGKASGLESGDVLEVREAGSWLRSPTGSPVAWIPGRVKGELRVDSLVGADVAAATLVQGQPPAPTDPLTLKP